MLTKVCTKCGVEKGVDEYFKKNDSKYGVMAECKCCFAEYKKAYREANREAEAERKRAYYEANKDAIAEYKKAHYAANKEAILEQQKSYYAANKEAVAVYKKAYQKANPHIINAIAAKRKAAKLQATPAWADLEAIKGIYLLAAINREGGFDLHVDHIVPLQSDIVCGLHCEANLQLMPASDNISKGNRRWPDMP